MPKLHKIIHHALGQEEAIGRIKQRREEAKTEHADEIKQIGLKEQLEWQGNICKIEASAMGFAGSGEIVVNDSTVEITLNLPWIALPFRGRIEQLIIEGTEKILNQKT